MKWLILSVAGLFGIATVSSADDKKPEGPITLKLVAKTDKYKFDGKPGWELQNMLTIARLMIAGALARDESRGTHFRSDFPARDDIRWGLRRVASEPFIALA